MIVEGLCDLSFMGYPSFSNSKKTPNIWSLLTNQLQLFVKMFMTVVRILERHCLYYKLTQMILKIKPRLLYVIYDVDDSKKLGSSTVVH